MKKSKTIAGILLFAFFLNTASPVFSEEDTTPKKYDDKEFPQGLKDLRRFEIVTLGAVPFVTLDTTLVYSSIRYAQHNFDNAYRPDLFSKSNFSEDEQKQILATSLGICVGIGLADYIFQLIKRGRKRKLARNIKDDYITITPISQDPDAKKIPLPESITENDNQEQEPDEPEEIEE